MLRHRTKQIYKRQKKKNVMKNGVKKNKLELEHRLLTNVCFLIALS